MINFNPYKEHKEYILNDVRWGVAGVTALSGALGLAILSLGGVYTCIGMAFASVDPIILVQGSVIGLSAGAGSAGLSNVSAKCFKHLDHKDKI